MSAGAKGLRMIANIETGQEIIQRWGMDEILYGYTGNWIFPGACACDRGGRCVRGGYELLIAGRIRCMQKDTSSSSCPCPSL